MPLETFWHSTCKIPYTNADPASFAAVNAIIDAKMRLAPQKRQGFDTCFFALQRILYRGTTVDFSTSVYDSTQHNNFYPAESTGKSLTFSELSGFVTQLLSTLELQELGGVYFQQLNMLLPVVGFSLSDFDSRWVYGNAKISSTLIDLPLQGASTINGEQAHVYYYISSPLSLSQRESLFQLHDLFGKQVKHALSLTRVQQMATKDILTGLGNRAGFEQSTTRQLGWAQRHDEPFALLVIDLDNFNSFWKILGKQNETDIGKSFVFQNRTISRYFTEILEVAIFLNFHYVFNVKFFQKLLPLNEWFISRARFTSSGF